ncbi:hypothetical protein [Billgrantia montanilacus]|uniref:Uncharacterized protein n=1 Tax=Billgrantia montanilacus TaxID=2282305 RepID=A0A368TY93_9GAMM|nr:hypothetical protein [Halomonas montanilacus]RCV89704.1 hypothetical protein DU505_08865 [Halomonas montanilacus]
MADKEDFAVPVLVDVPFTLEYDEATGLAHLTGPMIEQQGVPIGFRVTLTPAAQLKLREALEHVEREAAMPPSAHRRADRLQ